MADRGQKSTRLSWVQRPSPKDATPPNPRHGQKVWRNLEHYNQAVASQWTIFLTAMIVVWDVILAKAITSASDSPIRSFYGLFGTVCFFAGALAVCEYRLFIKRRMSTVEELDRFRLYISQIEFHSPNFNVRRFLMQMYFWVLGIHVMVVAPIAGYTSRPIVGDPYGLSLTLPSTMAVMIAIAVHALSVRQRYIISKERDKEFPTEMAHYRIGDDGEIEYISDESEYLLNVDGKVERNEGD